MAEKSSQKDPKKKAEKHDRILSDSESSVSDIDCEICGLSFSNVKGYEAHLQGKKHNRKKAEAKFKAKNQASNNKIEENDDEDAKDDDDDQMHCEVCDKYFSSYISFATHLKGSLHKKNLKKEKLKNQMKDMPEVVAHEEEDSEDCILKPYAKCSVCQKEFSGPESFKMHLKSTTHQKKVKQSSMLQKLKSNFPDGQKGSDDEEQFFKKCDTCQKSFSGIVPFQNHMLSKVHKKNEEKKKIAEEIKEFYDFDDGYICKECKKKFTDPLALKMHLNNNSHEKQKAKAALVEFLNNHPEIAFLTPLSKEGGSKEDESDSEESDSMYYLVCKLCECSFSGPESAQDHVKSKKHIHLKKEKKMRKLLKKQMENSAKSEDKILKNNENSAVSADSKLKNSNVYNHEDDFEVL